MLARGTAWMAGTGSSCAASLTSDGNQDGALSDIQPALYFVSMVWRRRWRPISCRRMFRRRRSNRKSSCSDSFSAPASSACLRLVPAHGIRPRPVRTMRRTPPPWVAQVACGAMAGRSAVRAGGRTDKGQLKCARTSQAQGSSLLDAIRAISRANRGTTTTTSRRVRHSAARPFPNTFRETIACGTCDAAPAGPSRHRASRLQGSSNASSTR